MSKSITRCLIGEFVANKMRGPIVGRVVDQFCSDDGVNVIIVEGTKPPENLGYEVRTQDIDCNFLNISYVNMPSEYLVLK